MTRHLADHPRPTQGARLRHFLRLSRDADRLWRPVWRRRTEAESPRRMVEFLRIARTGARAEQA